MFEFNVSGVEKLVKRLDEVRNKVHSLQTYIPREFEHWRTEDFHSKYPELLVRRRRRLLRVSTRIWNRGRGSALKHKKRRRRGSVRRPVLRAGLYEQLKRRMIQLVEETVQW